MARYTYLWAFRVLPGRAEEFLAHYESEGTWSQLFRRAPGYLGTRLLRDRADPLRFVTVDDWESEQHYRELLSQFSAEYEVLDRICDGLTSEETELGHFLDVAG